MYFFDCDYWSGIIIVVFILGVDHQIQKLDSQKEHDHFIKLIIVQVWKASMITVSSTA